MRRRFPLLLGLAATIGVLAAMLPMLTASAASTLPMTASFTTSDFAFTAAGGGNTVNIATGGTVNFSYPTGSSRHNVDFGSGPQPTSCTLNGSSQAPPIPSSATSPGWSGSCTFNTPGTYTFHCDLHTFMTGTIVVGEQTTTQTQPGDTTTTPGSTTPGSPTTTTPDGGGTATMPMNMPMNMPMPDGGTTTTEAGTPKKAKPSPLAGTPASAIKVAASQHGAQVHGTIRLSAAGRGGHVTITVLASRAALKQSGHTKQPVTLGTARLSHLRPGTAKFTVAIKETGRRALTAYRRLTATIRFTVGAPGGKTVSVVKTVVLRA